MGTTRIKSNSTLIGEIRMFAGAIAPAGWLICNGADISRTTYSALYSIIGTTYGSGNGSTTFNIPDFKGRMAIGVGNSGVTGDSNNSLGTKGGVVKHQHQVGESITNTDQAAGSPVVSLTNKTEAVSVRPPYTVINYIIYTGISA